MAAIAQALQVAQANIGRVTIDMVDVKRSTFLVQLGLRDPAFLAPIAVSP